MNFLTTLLLAWSAAWGADRYVEIDLNRFQYLAGKNKSNDVGSLVYSSVHLDWDGMALSLENIDNIHDARILLQKESLSFVSKTLSLSFPISESSYLHRVNAIEVANSRFEIDAAYFSFLGKSFHFSDGPSHLRLSDFNLYCDAYSDQYPMTQADGIIAGCLTSVVINSNQRGGLAGAQIDYADQTGGKSFHLKSRLRQFQIAGKDIKGDFNRGTLEFGKYRIETSGGKVTCLKDPNLITPDLEQIKSDCVNSMKLNTDNLVFFDEQEGTRFFLKVDDLGVRNQDFAIVLPEFKVANKDGNTSILGLEFRCHKEDETDLFDVKDVLQDCFIKGDLVAKSMITGPGKESFENFEKVFDKKNPVDIMKNTEKDEEKIKDLKIAFIDNQMSLEAKINVPVLGMKNLQIWGPAFVTKFGDKTRIMVNIKDARFWRIGGSRDNWYTNLGSWTAKSLILFILKATMVDGEVLDADGDYIYITF